MNSSFSTVWLSSAIKLIPGFKKDDCLGIVNYYAIFLLPIFLNIFEIVVKNRLDPFLEVNRWLDEKEYGFHSGVSTPTAVTDLFQVI